MAALAFGAVAALSTIAQHARKHCNNGAGRRYDLPSTFPRGRVVEERLVMARYIRGNSAHVLATLDGLGDGETAAAARALLDTLEALPAGDEDAERRAVADDETAAALLRVLLAYNTVRLRVRDPLNPTKLFALEQRYPGGLLPPPMPSEYLEYSVWHEWMGGAADKWVGHGWFWKHSTTEAQQKDTVVNDRDGLEDGFARLKRARVLVADYDKLQDVFPELRSVSRGAVNEWLLERAAYVSEGQLRRMQDPTDHGKLLDIDDIDRYVDVGRRRAGVRMKGGGRAAQFLVDGYRVGELPDSSELPAEASGKVLLAPSLDVKGGGTAAAAHIDDAKASGFLSYCDALKELAFERLFARMAALDGAEWSTISTVAIIDCGFRYRADVKAPATGYKGDRCVLTVRLGQSRLVASPGEFCYYSTSNAGQLSHPRYRAILRTLNKFGVSSERQPQAVIRPDGPLDVDRATAEEVAEGDWNLQSDATLTHLVDFSHWYALPESPLPEVWKLSEEALVAALQCKGPATVPLFERPHLMLRVFGTEERAAAEAEYARRLPALRERWGAICSGTIGERATKPKNSWSWFLETDDSHVMTWAETLGLDDSADREDATQGRILGTIDSWLPTSLPGGGVTG